MHVYYCILYEDVSPIKKGVYEDLSKTMSVVYKAMPFLLWFQGQCSSVGIQWLAWEIWKDGSSNKGGERQRDSKTLSKALLRERERESLKPQLLTI